MTFVVNIIEGVFDAVEDVVDWVVDEIVQPVVSGIGDVIDYVLDNPIEAIAKIGLTVVSGGAYAWAIPLVDGASTLAKGGSLEDAVKAAAISYAGSKLGGTAGQYASNVVKEATGSQLVASIVGAGTKSATTALVYGQDPLQAFLNGGLQAGVSAGLGYIDDQLQNITDEIGADGQQVISGWEDLQDGVKDSVISGLAAELEGGNISSTQMGSILAKYTGATKVMSDFLKDNTGLNKTQISVLTSAVTGSLSKAIAGNPDLAGEAFFGTLTQAGTDALKSIIDKPVNDAIDKVSGAYGNTETAASALNNATTNASAYADQYNKLQGELSAKIDEQERLKGVYNDALAAYNASQTEANFNAVNAAAADFNTYAGELETDYNNNYKNQLAAAENNFNFWNNQIPNLEADYQDALDWMVTKTEDLNSELEPKLTAADKAISLVLRPQFNEEGYREAMGLGPDVDVYSHYLENQKQADNIIAADIAAGYISMANNDVSADSLPNIPSAETRPTTYGAPEQLSLPDVPNAPNVDFTAPIQPKVYSGRGGDPRDYGLTEQEITKYVADNLGSGAYETFKTNISDAYRNATSGGLEAAAYTVGGIGTFANEVTENLIDTWGVDKSEADAILYNSYASMFDPNLTDEEKAEVLAENAAAYTAALDKAYTEQGSTVTFFSSYTDPIKEYLMGASEAEAGKISPEMQVRQYNALPAPDTTWEQILTGKAKDRLGRPYGIGDPLATIMSGVQELPDLAVDVALLAITKNPAVLGGVVATTSMAEAGEAAADEIESALIAARNSGELQKTQEYADLVRVFNGNEEAAFNKLVDQSMGYAATSGVIGGLGDVVLAKIAGASGASSLLNNVPVGLQTVVKIGTGGVAEGINEASEQVPVNMAQINAGLDTEVSAGTGPAFLVGTTSGGTAVAGPASLEAITDTVNKIKNGTYEYTMPDGSTVAPAPPSGDQTPYFNEVVDNLARFELYTNFLNDLSSWGAIPSNPADLTAPQLLSTLEGLGVADTSFINDVANTIYDSQIVTDYEVKSAFEATEPNFTLSSDDYTLFTGLKTDSDLATNVAAYIDPRYIDADEVKNAAASEGIVLTDEQIESYVGQKDEATAVQEIDADFTSEAEVRQFFADLGYTPTDAEVQQYVGDTAEAEQQANVASYVDPRQVTSDEARKFFEDQGYNPTDAEIAALVGQGNQDFETTTGQGVPAYVDPRQVTEEEARQFFADQGYEPTQDEINSYVGQGGADFEATAPDRVGSYVDPRQVTSEEAKQFFEDLGYTPTDEQVAEFTAQVAETTQQDVIAKYVDPRQVTFEELQAIADQEGLTLTEALAATYIGQGEAETFQQEQLDVARAEYDPLATTLDEATQFFANTGYNATTEEIAQFVASKTEEAQTSAIGAYVDPRQVTAAEAEEFLSAIGYQPTQEEIDQFVGQVNDENFQVTQRAEIDAYVDPRYVDAGEVRAAYEELGLVDVTQEDVDRFVGQFDEETRLAEVQDYLPTATFNVIGKVLGSPAVEDDPNTPEDESKAATGIYAEFEAGATRDEALQSAIDQLKTDLGLSETEVLQQLGITKDELSGEIDAVAADVATVKGEVTGLGEQITGVEETLGEQITGVEETLGEQITGVEETLGADINAIADIIGKPAQEVTQVDVDFVADVIAQTQVLDEIQTAQYDVTGDGIVDINDQNLLSSALQGEDVTFADTSMFGPATGIYGTIADVQSDLDTQTDTLTDFLTQMQTQIQTGQDEQKAANLLQMLNQPGMLQQDVSVKMPDPLQLRYTYDISGPSIFATPGQAQMFVSPFGGTRATPANMTAVPQALGPSTAMTGMMPMMPRAAGFAEGGIVDETDALLALLGDMD